MDGPSHGELVIFALQPLPSTLKTNRSAAIHFTLAIALFVMVAFAFSAVLSDEFRFMSRHYNNLIIDGFGGLFIFLCGMQEMLFTKKGLKSGKFTLYCQRKGMILAGGGFFLSIWFPVHPLIILGILFFLTPWLVKLGSGTLLFLAVLVLALGFKLYSMAGWPEYVAPVSAVNRGDFIPKSVVFVLFRSYYGIVPWAAYYFVGLVFGKINFSKKKNIRTILSWCIGLTILVLILDPQINKFYWAKPRELNTTFWPFDWFRHGALFPVIGVSICAIWIIYLTKLMEKIKDLPPVKVLVRVGRMKFTFFAAAVILGAGLMLAGQFKVIDPELLQRPEVIWSIIFFFIMACFVFTAIWRKYKTHGPLEKILMKLGGLHVG